MIRQDFDILVNSNYTRKQLCWIILQCLDIICSLASLPSDTSTPSYTSTPSIPNKKEDFFEVAKVAKVAKVKSGEEILQISADDKKILEDFEP
jgi:hypothetical protein